MPDEQCGDYLIPQVGHIRVWGTDDSLSRIELGVRKRSTAAQLNGKWKKQVDSWIAAYTQGRHDSIAKLPLEFTGATEFQLAVWRTIRKIPFGKTRTYQWIANTIDNPKAVRAVGQACGANRFPLIIPCHRVVATSGLGGFSGPEGWKQKLLTFEQRAS